MPAPPDPVVAVDGTAASGKSTFSRGLAARLGFHYVNTGVMYRGVTWYIQREGIDPHDFDAVEHAVVAAGVRSVLQGSELAFSIGGVDPLPHVRDARVNEEVSVISLIPAVRRLLVAHQQSLAAHGPLVMEGRDIGTVVFPSTPYKFFIDADAKVRAERRRGQGEADVIHERDKIDSQRKDSPLLWAYNAVLLDSGLHPVEEMIEMGLAHLAACGLKN